MQNRDLNTLRTIARASSFREAAERLNMTASAVSMQMKALEEALGAQLFDRATRPPRLTPLGRAVADKAEDVLDAEARLRRLTAHDATLAGRFRLGLVASAGPRLLPGFLGRVPGALPHARFDLRTGLSETLEAQVAEAILDGAVVTATGVPRGGLRHTRLARDQLVAAIPEDLAPDAPFLQFAPGTGIGRLIAVALTDLPDLARRRAIVLDHVETIRTCLSKRVGATILPEIDLPRDQGLTLTRLPAGRDLVLVTRIGSPLDAERHALRDLLVEDQATAQHS